MSDIKKLCKSDCLYWLAAALIMLGVVAYMVLHVFEGYLSETMEQIRRGIELWDAHPEWGELTKDASEGIRTQIPFDMLQKMMMGLLGTAFVIQAAKLLLQETKKRAEVLNLFPVKSRNRLTYYYISGLLVAGLPILIQSALIWLKLLYTERKTDITFEGADVFWSYAAKSVVIFMLQYSLLILCRRLASHVTGTIFTFVVMEVAMKLSAGRCLGIYWSNLAEDRIQNWIFWVIVTVVLIILSYIADWKKDYAQSGFYASPVVHWIMMGIVFLEVCEIFDDAFENIPKVVANLLMIAASLLITAGVHFLTKPKSIL